MPELPEVETFVRDLQPQLPGRRVLRARLRYRALYRRGSLGLGALAGRVVDHVERVGKNIVVRFRPGGLLLVNLGMTGRLVAWPARVAAAAPGTKHLHARIYFEDGTELRYYDPRRFGHFYVAEHCDFNKDLGIGPDPFVSKPGDLRRALSGRAASIKSLLLAQHIVSGIGNIYADEALFYARIHPALAGDRASRHAAAILKHTRVVLRRAIDHGGSTLRDYRRPDGTPGGFQTQHAVYGRTGRPCVRCGTSIERIVLAGRSAHFCPNCQS